MSVLSKVFLPNDLTVTICHRLPNPEMRRVTSVLAVMHPNNVDIIVLKSKFDETTTLGLKVTDFEVCSEWFSEIKDFSYFHNKKIILDRKILPKDVTDLLIAVLG
jgi:hypothetical protein